MHCSALTEASVWSGMYSLKEGIWTISARQVTYVCAIASSVMTRWEQQLADFNLTGTVL